LRRLADVRVRLFLITWVTYCLFFATNVVREHYPAFALVDHGNLRCDEYLGWHSDIFRYTDGHSYINNNVGASLLATVPLLVFDPVLDLLEAKSKRQLEAAGGVVDTTYDTKYPNRRALFRKAKLAGKDLRFGGATAVTSAFLMAPLSALCSALLLSFLMQRGLERRRAVWLSLLFAFGTPVFYRSASLNHNTLMMSTTFFAFLLLFDPRSEYVIVARRRFFAGLLCGLTFALDYSGVIPAAVLYGYFVAARASSVGVIRALRESLVVIAGGLPGLAIVLGSQYAQFGDPFLPAQLVMPAVNYTGEGLRGIGWPSFEIFLKGLISPGWGLYTFGPLLLLGLWPTRDIPDSELLLPRRERRMIIVLIVSYMSFCAMNRYSLMQFNTGLRYFALLVPFIFLQASDRLSRVQPRTLWLLTIFVVAHSTVMCMTREVNDTEKDLRDEAVALGISEVRLPGYLPTMLTESPIPMAYRRIVTEGPQLPWLTVLAQTSGAPLVKGPLLPSALILLVILACWGLWRLGEALESRSEEGRP
jgi:hypothetical protein